MSAVILRRIMRFICSLLLAALAVCEFKGSKGMRFCLWPVRFGSKANIAARLSDVRFTPEKQTSVDVIAMSALGHKQTSVDSGWRGATSDILRVFGRVHAPKKPAYSTTSSACTIRDAGNLIPSAFAVLRLTTSSNLVGCSTGSSVGFWPLMILSK
jgi:hypothetical protein